MDPIDIDRRYVIEASVGRGAFGEVFRAVDRSTGAHVALKRLHPHVADPETLSRLKLEARALARVSHPNVVGFVGFGLDAEGRPCLLLDWLEGIDLGARRRRSPPGIIEAVEWVRQAALALDALHAAGIVHRDVKPSNFVLVEHGTAPATVKLIDLGIARVLDASRLTASGVVLGTPAYMSPEQARGSDEVTARSDLYSLGVMLYELLAGRRPFATRDMRVLLAQILLQDPPAIQQFVAVPDDLASIVHTMLAKSPDERFASGAALAVALQDALDAHRRRTLPSTGEADFYAPTDATPIVNAVPREQRLVTVVFVELPTTGDARRMLDAAEHVARSEEGLLEPMLGRRALLVFGAVASRGDETLRAARASLRIRRRVAGSRIALVTCRVAARSGAIDGDALVQLAEHFDRASAHGVGLDAASARLLGDAFDIEARDGAYVLLAASAYGRPARVAGKRLPTVGRDRELEWLFGRVAQVRDQRRAAAFTVFGPVGIGKTRLRAEFITRLASSAKPPRILLARGDVLRSSSPFSLLGDLLQDAAGIGAADGLEACRARLRSCVAQSVAVSDVNRVTEFLGECVGIPFPDEASPQLRAARDDPRRMGDQIARAFQDWLLGESAHHAVVIALDDVQWADAASLATLRDSMPILAQRTVAVIAFGREALVWPRAQGSEPEHPPEPLELGRLDRDACGRLAREALGDEASSARVSALVDRADGNAFFLEELIRAETAGQGGSLPLTVHALVQARLDALESSERDVLRAASVFGGRFALGGVRAVLEDARSVEGIASVAETLAGRELLVRTSPLRAGAPAYAFAQPLVRDAAYASLDDATRKRYHRLAASWLESHDALQPGVLAEHYERGDQPAQAVRAYKLAALLALRGNDYEGTIEFARRGLAIAPDGPFAGELYLLRGEAERWRGDLAAAISDASQALARLAPGRSPFYRAITDCARLAGSTGNMAGLAPLASLLHATVPAPEAVSAAAFAMCVTATHLRVQSRWDEALALTDAMDRTIGSNPSDDPALEAMRALGRATRARHAGDLGGAVLGQARAAALWDTAGELRESSILGSSVGYGFVLLGAFARAKEVLERALAQAERLAMRRLTFAIKHNLGYAYARLGDLARAAELQREAAAWATRVGDVRLEWGARTYVAFVANLSGDFATAEATARSVAEAPGLFPDGRVEALAELAVALRETRDASAALTVARQMVSLLDSIPSHDNAVYVRVAAARAFELAGDAEQAAVALRAARRVLVSTAERIADPALRDSYLHAVPEHAYALAHGAE